MKNNSIDFIKIQYYNLHLINGNCIEAAEEYGLPYEETIIHKWKTADDKEIFAIIGNDVFNDDEVYYVQKQRIIAISTDRAAEISKKAWLKHKERVRIL